MLLFIDNKEFQSIVTNVRAIDDFDDTKIQEIVKELKSA
jgi:hypothetical protein